MFWDVEFPDEDKYGPFRKLSVPSSAPREGSVWRVAFYLSLCVGEGQGVLDSHWLKWPWGRASEQRALWHGPAVRHGCAPSLWAVRQAHPLGRPRPLTCAAGTAELL